ncbi:hypothetical protein CWB96_03920 [Pseudoalteromonas citrea]|uniref:Cadherin domain-containing protein n=3 Tax=Pseudoalteromonas TaxID=53246 RepID=A0A5S3XT35_9GAMM|nr:hypothetical protein CWB97_05090 [Pseudoalteromonas citrea]TMP61440.1 hypothetical protein CWB96_03920 [Pseudoalteromonas citrea]
MMTPPAHGQSQKVNDHVFLKGRYLAMGVNELGTFGSKPGVTVPDGFKYYTKGADRLGLFIDLDGLDDGAAAVTTDFFLPGAEFEGFVIAYKKAGELITLEHTRNQVQYTPANKQLIMSSIEDLSFGNELKARWVAKNEDIVVTITHSFSTNDQYYLSFVAVENIGTEELTELRFSRGVDPDQESGMPSGGTSTINTILSQYPSTRVAVEAKGINSGVSLYLATEQANSVVHNQQSFNQTNLHGADSLWESYPSAGDSVTQDRAVYLVQDRGTVASGKAASFYLLTGLTNDMDAAFTAFGNKDEDQDGTLNSVDPEPVDPCIPSNSVRACTNTAPVFSSAAYTTYTNQTLTVTSFLSLITDADNDAISVKGSFSASNGVVSQSGNDLVYLPTTDFNGSDVISFIVSDGLAEITVSINVTVVENKKPIVSTMSLSIAEDTVKTLSPMSHITDENNSTLKLTAASVDIGSVTISSDFSNIEFTPQANYVGNAAIQYTVQDEQGLSSDGVVNVTITSENDAPVISGSPVTSVLQGQLYDFTPVVTDIDTGDAKVFTITNMPDWAAFDTATGRLHGTPNNSHVGEHSAIVISVSDSGNLKDSLASFTITVVNVNDAPVISGVPNTTVLQDKGYEFTPTVTDIDVGDSRLFSIVNQPSWTTFDSTSGQLSGTPSNAHIGEYKDIVISVSDTAKAVSTLAAFTISVENVNDAPVISGNPVVTIDQDVNYDFVASVTDVDVGDTHIFSILNKPSWATFDSTLGRLTGTPKNEHVGQHSGIVISATDAKGLSHSLNSFTITVENVNDAPTISGVATTTINEKSSYSFTPVANDIDTDDELTFSIVNKPEWADFNAKTGELSGIAEKGKYESIVISVQDKLLEKASLSAFTIDVADVNFAPTVSAIGNISVDEGAQFTSKVVATDIDVDTLTYALVNAPSWVNINTLSGGLTFTPFEKDIGIYTNLAIDVSDGIVTTRSNEFSVTVNNVQHFPDVSISNVVMDEDTSTSLAIQVRDNDSEQTHSVSIATQPKKGAIWLDETQVTSGQRFSPEQFSQLKYRPNLNYNGQDSLVLSITDSMYTVTSSVAIQVNPVDDLPTSNAVVILDSVSEDHLDGVVVTKAVLLSQNEDIESDLLAVKEQNYAGKYGQLRFDNGQWHYQFNYLIEELAEQDNFEDLVQPLIEGQLVTETINVDVIYSDKEISESVSQRVTFEIQGRNDAPIISDPLIPDDRSSAYFSFGFEEVEVGQVFAEDIDENATLSFSLIESSDASAFTIDEEGFLNLNTALTFDTVKAGAQQTFNLTVVVSDGLEAVELPLAIELEYGNDVDGDGTSNEDEVTAGTDPFDNSSFPDADKDGVSDQLELEQGTDINDPLGYLDSDLDGVPDYQETLHESDPNDGSVFIDTDGDSTPDYVEQQQGTDLNDSSSFLDSDGDLVPDAAEHRLGTDPMDPSSYLDTDGDGTPDIVEVINGTDPEDESSVLDSDGDGVSDYQEHLAKTDPNDPDSFDFDSDRDGVYDQQELLDSTDPLDPRSHKDSDGDGVSDALEIFSKTDPEDPLSYLDADEDWVPDFIEFLDGMDETDAFSYLDSDSDNVPDYVEMIQQTDPFDKQSFMDTDADGTADYTEIRNGTDPRNPADKDVDGDLVPDNIELMQGTDPNDINSFLDSDLDGDPDHHELLRDTDINDPYDYLDTDADGISDAQEIREGTDWTDLLDFIDTDGDRVSDREERLVGTDPLDAASYIDSDGDLMPDAYELRHDLDPFNPADADQDADLDGFSNVYEYLNGLNPSQDSVPPEFVARAQVWLNATERETIFNDDVFALDYAVDLNDGIIELQRAPIALVPGTHSIVLEAKDSLENTAQFTQTLHVRPLIDIAADAKMQLTTQQGTLSFPIVMNGLSPVYPLTVNYVLSGEIESIDKELLHGQLTITHDMNAPLIELALSDDLIGSAKQLKLALYSYSDDLQSADYINVAPSAVANITLTEDNLAPVVSLSLAQQGKQTVWLDTGAGEAQLTALAKDANVEDTLTYEWAFPAELSVTQLNESSYSFDTQGLSSGSYSISLTVTDDHASALSSTATIDFMMTENTPLGGIDSDRDGISDEQEGRADSDGDRIPDFADDRFLEKNQIAIGEADALIGYATSELGTHLKLGKVAWENLNTSIAITQMPTEDTGYTSSSALFDFEIADIDEGTSTRIVIPLSTSIPSNAQYRKYNAQLGWYDFVEDANNQISSTKKVLGRCPPIGHELYQPGLHLDDECLQLTIEDGGANDDDGIANGIVVDPGVIAVRSETEGSDGATDGSGSDNTAEVTDKVSSGGSMFFVMVMMLLLALKRRMLKGVSRAWLIAATFGVTTLPFAVAANESAGDVRSLIAVSQLSANVGEQIPVTARLQSPFNAREVVVFYQLTTHSGEHTYVVGKQTLVLNKGVNNLSHVLEIPNSIPSGAYSLDAIVQNVTDVDTETVLAHIPLSEVSLENVLQADLQFLYAELENHSFVLGAKPVDTRKLNKEQPFISVNMAITSQYLDVLNPVSVKYHLEFEELGVFPLTVTSEVLFRDAIENDEASDINTSGQVAESINGLEYVFKNDCEDTNRACKSVEVGSEVGAEIDLYATELLYDTLVNYGGDLKGKLVITVDPDELLSESFEGRKNNRYAIPVIYLANSPSLNKVVSRGLPENDTATMGAPVAQRGTVKTYVEKSVRKKNGSKSKFRLDYKLSGKVRYRVGNLGVPYEGFFDAGTSLDVYMFKKKFDFLDVKIDGDLKEDPYNSYWKNKVKILGKTYWDDQKYVKNHYKKDFYVLWKTKNSKGKERYKKYKKKEKKKNYYYWGIKFQLKGAIKGEAGITGNVYVARGNILGSTIGPYVSIDASGGVSVNAWVAKAGVKTSLNLMRLDAPFSTTLQMLGGNYASLQASLDFVRRHLDGKVEVWAKWKKPKWIGFKWHKKSKSIMKWKGKRYSDNLWQGGKVWGEQTSYTVPKIDKVKIKTKLYIKKTKHRNAYVTAKGRIASKKSMKLFGIEFLMKPAESIWLKGCSGKFKKKLTKSFNKKYKLPRGCRSVTIEGELNGYQFSKRRTPSFSIY